MFAPNMQSIYISNGVGIFILVILLIVSRTKILRYRIEDRIYTMLCFGVMLGCFFEAFSYTIDGKLFPGSIILNYIANTYLYSFNLILSLTMVFYVDLCLYDNTARLYKHYTMQKIVAVIMLSLNIANLFYPIIYTISPGNSYARLPFSYSFYVAILFYFVTAYLVEKNYEKLNGTRSFFNISAFLLPISIGTGLQFMYYGLSLAWLSCAIGLTGLYMMQQNELAYVDPLVDTYNRQYLNNVLSAWINRKNRFYGIMIDIDHFKQINDTFGHSEGDRALKTVTDILKASRQDNELVFRFAGDEFIVLKRSDVQNGMDDYINEVERRLKEYNAVSQNYKLSLSYGVSYFEDADLDAFMKEIDTKMYEMKASHHEDILKDS